MTNVPRTPCVGCADTQYPSVGDQQLVACCLNDALSSCASNSPTKSSSVPPTYSCPKSTHVAFAGVGCAAEFQHSATFVTSIVLKGTTGKLQASSFMENGNFVGSSRDCGSTGDMEIKSLRVSEASGFPIAANITYQNKTGGGINYFSGSGNCSYAVTSSHTWIVRKVLFPAYIYPIVTVTCGDVQDCVVKYEVKTTCVDLLQPSTATPAPTTATSNLSKTIAAIAKTDSCTKDMTLVASIAAVIVAMRFRG